MYLYLFLKMSKLSILEINYFLFCFILKHVIGKAKNSIIRSMRAVAACQLIHSVELMQMMSTVRSSAHITDSY